MKIAITGASGFLGNYIINELLANNHKINALSRKRRVGKNPNLKWYQGDINCKEAISKFLDDCDVICNCAGEITDQKNYESTNIEGTRTLYELSIKLKINLFIQISSAGIYDDLSSGLIDEDHKIKSTNLYEKSKIQAERILKKSHLIRTIILRPTTIYGSDMPNNSLKDLLSTVLSERFFFIGSSKSVGCYISAHNVASAVKTVIENNSRLPKKNSTYQVYNLSDDILYSDLISQAAICMKVKVPRIRLPYYLINSILWFNEKIIGIELPLTRTRLKHLTRLSSFSSEKFKKSFSWEIPYKHSETIDECISVWFDNKSEVPHK